MIPNDRLEQIVLNALEVSNRAFDEINAEFPTEPNKALACVMAEITISRAIESLDPTQRKLVITHMVTIDDNLTKLGL